jgi:RHS repeat-associated protein
VIHSHTFAPFRGRRALSGVVAIAVGVTIAISGAVPAQAASPRNLDNVKPVKGATAGREKPVSISADAKSDPAAAPTFEVGESFAVAIPDAGAPEATPTADPTASAEPDPRPTATPSASATPALDAEAKVVPASARVTAPEDTGLGEWEEVGSTGISVTSGAPDDVDLGAVAPTADPLEDVQVEFLDPDDFANEGVVGLVMRVTREDNGDNGYPVSVKVPDEVLDSLYGAGFSSRATWIVVPDTTTSRARPVPVETTTGSDGTTVLSAQPSGDSVTFAAVGSGDSSDGSGSYAATPISEAGSWDISAQTGAFSWSYPMSVPPPAAGPTPSLALSYNSQAVDGMTSATNNQATAVGLGWTLGAGGYIDRQYVSCSEDEPGVSHPTSGDLCWKQDNATISFGGHSGPLIQVGTTNVWKYQDDDGTKIVHAVGSAQGCTPSATGNTTKSNDCWIITTTDGTKYYFGLNVLPSSSGTVVQTNSAWTVPVFGDDSGEPCYSASGFSASSCMQAWRWNLDYVVDVHGNAEAFYYNVEKNNYRKLNTTVTAYTRGGSLAKIDYGFRHNTAYVANTASDRIAFTYDSKGRCVDYASTPANCTTEQAGGPFTTPSQPGKYLDTPWDQLCVSGTCAGKISPTFWTTTRLSSIGTLAKTAATVYSPVDTWTLSHTWPNPGDGLKGMWLSSIQRTGGQGTTALTEPATVFDPIALQNRVANGADGYSYLDTMRLEDVHLTTGGVLSVSYSEQECTAANRATILAHLESNTKRCFPQSWTPPSDVDPHVDLFHKYVVDSFVSDPVTGGGGDAATETHYVYGTPAWRYNRSPFTLPKYRTWSEFAGFDQVTILDGASAHPESQRESVYYFYQGLDGDNNGSGGTKTVNVHVPGGAPDVPDSLWFGGQTRYVEVYDSAATDHQIVSTTLTTPRESAVTAGSGYWSARSTGDGEAVTTEPLAAGGTRTVTTKNYYDDTMLFWLPTKSEEVHSDASDSCTFYSYATTNTTLGIVGLPKETRTVATTCSGEPAAVYPQDAISDTRWTYDGGTVGSAATRGLATKVETVDKYTGTTAATAHWVTKSSSTYDALGRPLVVTDVLGRTSTSAYTPAVTGPLTQVTATSTAPFNWVSTTTYEPAHGQVTSTTDANGHLTTVTFDSLGRRTGVWYPDRPKVSNVQPSIGYTYVQTTTSTNAVGTSTVGPLGILTSWDLYDGLSRFVQAQTPADGNGTLVTTSRYDPAGRVIGSDNPYYTDVVNPSSSLFVPTSQSAVPSWTATTYDGLDRPLVATLGSYGAVVSTSTTSYDGSDVTTTDPPTGGTPTTSMTNSRGQTTLLTQYLADSPLSTANTVATSYEYDAQGHLSQMTDDAGNVWSWKYDLFGHQTSATDPDSGTTTSTYDLAGNVISSTDARGSTISTTYDALGRQTAVYQGPASTGALLTSYVYDTLSKGQQTSMTSYTGSVAGTPGLQYKQTITGYDAADRPLGTTVSIPTGAPAFGGQSFTTTMIYNKSGLVSKMTLPAMGGIPGETLSYEYEELGKQISLTGGGVFVNADYDHLGRVSYIERAGTSDILTAYGYDQATSALDAMDVLANTGSGLSTLSQTDYERDLAGNITSISTGGPSLSTDTQCFQVDALRAMTEAWTPANGDCDTAPASAVMGGPAPYWQSYEIDPSTGNRTSITRHGLDGSATFDDTYSYGDAGDPRPHALLSVQRDDGTVSSASDYDYDAAGSTIDMPGQQLTYDAFGRIATVQHGSDVQSRVYDATGGLLLQSDPVEGSVLYIGATQIKLAPGGSSASASREYQLNGVTVAEKNTVAGVAGSKLIWICANDQATPIVGIDDASGTATRRYLDPFGGQRGNAVTWTSSRNFLDKPISQLTGLVQHGLRAYDTTIGRFLSVDPVLAPANPQQNSGYNYGWNNPVSASDPTGMIPDDYAGTNYIPPHPTSGTGGGNSGTSKPPHAAGNNRSATKSQPDKPQQEWWNPFTWNGDTWQTIGAVAAGVAVAVVGAVALAACIAATVGICAGVVGGIAVGMAAGAAIGAASSAVTYGLSPGEKDAGGWAMSIGIGAGLGALTGGIGPAASSVISAGTITATQQGVSAAIRSGATATATEALSAGGAAAAGGAGGAGLTAGANNALRDAATGQFVTNPASAASRSAVKVATGAINGNSKASTALTTLYRLVDSDGNLLKWGVTNNPGSRYTQSFLSDKTLIKMTTGTRPDMLNLERWLVENNPGPLNHEPWAGAGS